ncbi:MAG: NADH-quinone oxidoreductase subunit H [Ignisphaera sp.]
MANALELISIAIISLILYSLLPPLLDGIERKIRADIQSRVGPPTVLQTWYDILKLMSKEVVAALNVKVATIILSMTITLLLFIGVYISAHLAFQNINIFFIATTIVLAISTHILNTLVYTISSNPFSFIGTFRALTINIGNEVGFITFYTLSALTMLTSLGGITLFIISFIPLLISVFVAGKRLPYDLHEAEPELASGSIIEFSGPILGLYLYSHTLDRYVFASIPISLALAIFKNYLTNPFIYLLLLHIFTILLFLLFAIVSIMLGRSRIDIAFKTVFFIYLLAILMWVGVYVFTNFISI